MMRSKREKELKRELERQIPDLNLDPAEPIDGALVPHCVGVAFAVFSPEVDVETGSGDVADVSPSALETEVTGHLETWESLPPEEFAKRWKDLATDPYVGVGPHWVGLVDDEIVAQWMKSDDLQEALRSHPPHSPREVTLSNLRITHLSPARILVTYRAEEEYTNGKTTAGNTFAVLFRTSAGWKIGVASKGTRHEARLRQ